jgi:hypothetical protein
MHRSPRSRTTGPYGIGTLAGDMTHLSISPVNARNNTAPFTIAVMQPYFIPYAGYFRLFAASDLFVIYDCVQFPRRGWVHRNRIVDQAGTERWLTLPLEKAPRDVLIRDLRFAPDAPVLFEKHLRRFRFFTGKVDGVAKIFETLRAVQGTPVDYIERVLGEIAGYLALPWNVIRSSSMDLPPSLRGQQRILEIASRLGARRYVNSPGGRSLYDVAAFEHAGIELRFLPEYPGPKTSILSRLFVEDRDDLSRSIRLIAEEAGLE